MKYFTETIEYPTVADIARFGLSHGTLFEYVSSTFLEGWVNYFDVCKAFMIERYHQEDDDDEPFDQAEFDATVGANKPDRCVHPRLSDLGDDVLILSRTKPNGDAPSSYMFFWFDCDTSDCCIGRFETNDSHEEVLAEFTRYVEGTADKVHEIPVEYLKGGWVSW